MTVFFNTYNHFVSFIPAQWQWVVSLVLLVLIIHTVLRFAKHSLLLIVIIVVLFPAALPILVNFGRSLLLLLAQLAGK